MSADHRRRANLVAASLLLLPGVLFAQTAPRPTLRSGAMPSDLLLDGRLTEPAWAAADSIAGLTQVEPEEGGRPTGRTVVRVLANADALVVGIVAYDPAPDRIVSHARSRDADLDDEDHVKLVLDTFLDGRSGYVFAVNPSGARYDALVTSGGGFGGGTTSENENWDAVWEAATVRTPEGWSAEIRIPVKSLIFRKGLDHWGLNVERRVERLQETDRWAGASRDWNVTQTGVSGFVTGLPPFDLGLGLSVRPSVTGGVLHTVGEGYDNKGEPSLDVTQRLGANLLGSLTVNTDFAETEVDSRQTNLTRFPLYFPEKRTFFLEGSDIFDFGQGLSGDHATLMPFFSRRIGLVEGRQVPIDGGLKMNGRAGATNIGALVVRTRPVSGLAPAATMGALRVKQNVLQESSVGMIATVGDPLGRAGSWTAGADATYQTSSFAGSRNLVVGLWGLAMNRDDLAGDRTAAGGTITYPNDLWNLELAYARIGDAFQPSLGFVPRPGVHTVSAEATVSPRPGRLGIRQCFVENRADYVAGLDGRWQSWRYFMAPINCRLESGDRFEFNWVPQGEQLDGPFDVAENVVLPAGAYTFTRWRLEAETASKRAVSVQATRWFGGFYTGSLHQIELEGTWRPSALVAVEVNAERDIGRLPEGRFTIDLVGTRLRLGFSPDLEVASLVQYDTES
ncbi:MAG: DUF5916 domain-containing protein, partial [Gemmatimonadota bacterium]